MEISKIKLTQIEPADYNPRTITEEARKKLRNSIETFGLVEPIIINTKNNRIVSGHQRYDILLDMLMESDNLAEREFDYLVKDDYGYIFDFNQLQIKNEDYEKALNIVLNNTNLMGDYDYEKLESLLTELEFNGFDLTFTGFDNLEDIDIDLLGDDFSFGEETDFTDTYDDEYDLPNEDEIEVTVELGDLYQLGNHRLLCGDATKEEDVKKLMQGAKADMVFTDPPYNVNYSNIERPKPSKKDLKTTIEFYTSLKETNITFNQMLIWKKPMLLGRNKYQYSHEPCIFAIKGSPYFTEDRTKTTVWDFGGYNKSNNVHPTQKPLFLPIEAIQNSSKENQKILDLFGGSGSTLIACEQLNRNCYTMEIDPYYCQVIINRWEEFTGLKAEKVER